MMSNVDAPEVIPEYDNEKFEKDLREILEESPHMNNCSNTVAGGMTQIDVRVRTNTVTPVEAAKYPPARPTSLSSAAATTDVPLSTPPYGDFIPKSTSSTGSPATKLDSIKAWGVSTYKCTKQYLSERLGKATKTVDLELDSQIDCLRDTQKKYLNILRLARALTNHFMHVVQTQRALGETFAELSQKCSELQDEFSYNSETQRTLVKNGEILLGALNFFISSVNTLVNKTMEDTILTVRHYEIARLEYDAYRCDLDTLTLAPRETASPTKLADTKTRFEEQKNKYERLRGDVAVKLKFLEENKVKVMHKQLLLFHNAVSAYFTGNETALQSTLKQFNISLTAPNAGVTSWLEK